MTLIHGIAQCFSKKVERSKIVNVIVNFVFITLTWTVFRAESLRDVFLIFFRIITLQGGVRYLYIFTPLYLVLVLLIDGYQYKINSGKSKYAILDLRKEKEFAVFVLCVMLTIALMYFGNGAFIYNNF